MNKIIGFYGSWRSPEISENYKLAKSYGAVAAKHGFTVLTGAYCGIMEAAPRGAKEKGGKTLGYSCSKLDDELRPNSYLDKISCFSKWEERIARSVGDASVCVFFPGRTGTAAELAVAVEMRAKGEKNLPIIVVGDFWLGFFEWLKRSNSALGLPADEGNSSALFEQINNAEMFDQFLSRHSHILSSGT